MKNFTTAVSPFARALAAGLVAMLATILVGTEAVPVWVGLPFVIGGLVALYHSGRELPRS